MALELEALAGLLTSLAGAGSKFYAASELGGAASELSQLGVDETSDLLTNAAAQSRALHQRANAALQDISTLNALTDSNIRNINREEGRTRGLIAASAAGSGVGSAGSPLQAQLTASIEYSRAIGVQRLRQRYASTRLQFELEQSLARAEDVLSSGQTEAAATARLRSVQAASLRRRQLQTILSGVGTIASPANANAIRGLTKKTAPEPGLEALFE